MLVSITQKSGYCLSCSKKYEQFVTPDCDHFNQAFTSKVWQHINIEIAIQSTDSNLITKSQDQI